MAALSTADGCSHRAFLAKHYAAGTFLASGPKEPRTGGMILASCKSVEDLAAALAQDPFHMYEVAEYRVTKFHVRAAGPRLESLVGA